MNTYLIGYDLNRPRKETDYPELIKAIKESFGTWWHNLDSTWIVKSDQSAAEICNSLKTYIDEGDELLVVLLSGVGAWTGFSDKASSWLKDNL